jgi:hypothetical protein
LLFHNPSSTQIKFSRAFTQYLAIELLHLNGSYEPVVVHECQY